MVLPVALYRVENLSRAWRWIRSNPDRGYKTYFRDHYSAYAIAETSLLSHLSEQLRRGSYMPAPSCKIFLPKPSGILRPYTLLDIEDQIVYQAAANVVAEKMLHRVRHRYLSQVFGHLYAGINSKWFYRKWSSGYQAFNKAAIKAHSEGNVFTASFDLTAFYDSIDHRVLTHFLEEFNVDREVSHALQGWLSEWTRTDAQILQGHGIPQGPLSSGLIAETVLSHLDNHGWEKSGVVYLRYVDDIRLFARTEHALRGALIRLDHLSKDVGLFPQSSKISIHRITEIQSEFKSASHPVESVVSKTIVDQKKLYNRLAALSPRYRVGDATKFKYLLAHAQPNARLTNRLWIILDRAPEFYESVARYLARSRRFSRSTSRAVVDRITKEKLYPAVAAAFLRSAMGRLHPDEISSARKKLKAMWAPRSRAPDFTVALGQWLFAENALTENQSAYVCAHGRSSWIRSALLLAANEHLTAPGLRNRLATAALHNRFADPAICGAIMAGKNGFRPPGPQRLMKRHGALVLKEFGVLRRAGGAVCGIYTSIEQILGPSPDVAWKQFFGENYRSAERQIVSCRGYAGGDASAWVNGLDVFNDYLLDALFRKDGTLGGYSLGNIGSATHSPSNAFKTKYPSIFAYAKAIHDKRYESDLSHPLVGKTGKTTGRIPFTFIAVSKKLMKAALQELKATS